MKEGVGGARSVCGGGENGWMSEGKARPALLLYTPCDHRQAEATLAGLSFLATPPRSVDSLGLT